MVKQRAVRPQADDDVWVCGLSLDDFLAPAALTPIAQVAQSVAAVTLDLALQPEVAQAAAEHTPEAAFLAPEPVAEVLDLNDPLLAGWASGAEKDEDYANRKVLWPELDPASYAPATSVAQRIEDNIAAIRLMKALASTKSAPTPAEMTQLLRYSGWGGAARVFSPDGSSPHKLAAQRNELQQLCTPKEFAGMQASVNTAFYTPPELVRALWSIVEQLGFEGGRIIEACAGVGHMIAGMPRPLARRSALTAVEVDATSAAILETCFAPFGLQVYASALENTKQLPIGFYDVAVTNVPFGDFPSNDTSKAPYAKWSIHNWFLAKQLELVRPGGLVAAITTSSTLDSLSGKHRQWLAAHAELVAAYRLPTMAFKDHSGTEAVTDIVVFKRRELPDFTVRPTWLEAVEAPQELFAAGQPARVADYGRGTGHSRPAAINAQFVDTPQDLIGRLAWQSGPHGAVAVPMFDGDMAALAARLAERIETLPNDVYTPAKADVTASPVEPMVRYANLDNAQPGAFVVHDGRICICEGAELVDVDSLYSGTGRKRLLGMMAVRDAAQAVIEHQVQSTDEAELKRLQAHLNGVYDAFVGQLGALSTSANSRIMSADPTWPLLLALEVWDEDAETVSKADIFTKRTVGAPEIPAELDSVKDAMLISLSLHGVINLGDMAKRLRKPVQEVIDQMREQAIAYRDPALGRWVPADEYLSGHIRDKIAQAKAAGPAYEGNVVALEAVVPPDLGPAEVEARLGAPWIPCDVVQEFATDLVKCKLGEVDVTFDSSTATWSIATKHWRLEYVGDRTMQTVKWGTAKRCALTLLEAALNQQPPTITQTVDNRQVVDAPATFAAREKWQAIRDEFRMWAYREDTRRDRLLRIYNDTFNQVRVREFDGSHLHLPGMTTAVTPMWHQKSAIWRVLVTGNTLLAHPVGAGKTLTMVAASMELRRLGKARKPVHAVPNHMLSQYAAEAVRLYPQAKVLMASKDDLHGDRRRQFVARIATGDWDLVVMTQSTFERLALSPEVQGEFIDSVLAEARTMMELAQDRGAKRSIKEIEKRMKEQEAKVRRLADAKADDQTAVWFEELGCDWVFLDEAHAYKNLMRFSKMPRIAGLSNAASQRAFDVYMKTRLIMRARGDREEGVVLATATPLTNSIAEMHTMQVYVQPQTLKRHGIYEFDAWSATFGEAVTGIELAPDGSGFRTNTRYSRFINTPELIAIFRGSADIRTEEELKLPTPRVKGDKPQAITCPASSQLKAIVAQLVERADAIRNRSVKPDQDNMLAITNDGRRAALDIRLFDPSLQPEPGCKLEEVANNVHRIWLAGLQERHTQLVFCDIGTPGAPGFSVYEELRRLFIARGIPEREIAFIQDYDSDTAKEKLFKKIRAGIVRIALASTAKMGVGTNVQTRLKAVHGVDVPWTPASVTQRDGRAKRRGNTCEEIELLRYIAEGSFDAYSYNLLDVKARFIDQVLSGDKGVRSVEDISMTAMTYAELKAIASGNPLVLEKAGVDAKVQKLSRAYDQYEHDRWRLAQRKAALNQRLAWINTNMGALELDAQAASQVSAASRIQGLNQAAAAAMQGAADPMTSLGAAFKAVATGRQEGRFARIDGFEVVAMRGVPSWDIAVVAPNSGLRAMVERPHMNDLRGVGGAVLATIAGIEQDPAKLREEFGRKTEELQEVEQMLTEEFAQREELVAARARQAEIEAMLDLDKDAAGTQQMTTEDAA